MLTAYFDDANSDPKSPVPMVAGYLASTFQWSRFNEQWAKLLRRHEVPIDPGLDQRISHRSKMHPKNTVFGEWIKNHRQPFLEEASRIIRHHIRMPIGNAVYRKDFDEIVPKSFANTIGGAYGWCVHNTLYAIRGYRKKNNYKEPIRIVFEQGTQGQGQVCKWYTEMKNDMRTGKEFGLGELSFDDKTVKPLQAADFLAYALGRYAIDYESGITRAGVTEHLRDVLGEKKPKDHRVVFWNRSGLESLARDLAQGGFQYWAKL